eukprot:1421685-Pleurochrysis_carterae.AAC.1
MRRFQTFSGARPSTVSAKADPRRARFAVLSIGAHRSESKLGDARGEEEEPEGDDPAEQQRGGEPRLERAVELVPARNGDDRVCARKQAVEEHPALTNTREACGVALLSPSDARAHACCQTCTCLSWCTGGGGRTRRRHSI